MLSAILLLLQLWDSGTQETDNERSAQGTSAPLLPLLHRFQSMTCGKDTPHTEEDTHVSVRVRVCISGVILKELDFYNQDQSTYSWGGGLE